MNVKLQNRNLHISQPLNELINRKTRKVRKMLPSFKGHDLDLHVTIEKHSTAKHFETTLVLTTPQTALRVHDVEESPLVSVSKAFDELLRKVKRFKAQLNRERFWQRKPVPQTAVPPEQLENVEKAINDNLEKIDTYVRRSLFHQALVQHFPPGMIQPQALVDEVFLEVSSEPNRRPDGLSVEQWMFQVAGNLVARRLEQLEAHRSEAHIEEPTDVEDRWDDEVLSFYQPDEALRIEDILPDRSMDSPEDILAEEELEDLVQKTIAELPDVVRESFVLVTFEGFNPDEVSMITGREAGIVQGEVEQARIRLRQVLASA